ncbi:MAG: DMT family transporter [Actinomycetales bacterium]|nr:DMT family transporter [Actinomycetales bacterium]
MHRQQRLTLFSIGVMWFVGGSIYPFLSHVTEQIEPINIIVLRSTGAALIMFIAALIICPQAFKEFKWDSRLIPMTISSLIFSPICSGALAWSSNYIPGAVSALMYSTLPMVTTIWLVAQGKKVSATAVAGIVLATISVVFLIGAPQGQIQTLGVIAALVSVMAWMVATEIWIKYDNDYPLVFAIFIQVSIGAMGTWIVRPFFDSQPIRVADALNINIIFLTAALASQYWAYLALTRRVSPAMLTSFAFVNPLVAGLIGFIYFDQRINTLQMFSGLILLVGIYLLVREEKAIFRAGD